MTTSAVRGSSASRPRGTGGAARCQVSGVRCQVSGVRCQVSGVRCQVSGVRRPVPGDLSAPTATSSPPAAAWLLARLAPNMLPSSCRLSSAAAHLPRPPSPPSPSPGGAGRAAGAALRGDVAPRQHRVGAEVVSLGPDGPLLLPAHLPVVSQPEPGVGSSNLAPCYLQPNQTGK
jgi:hypothetical protein